MLIYVTPLAADSLGVRSMACYVETPDLHILLDAGVALGPRFGLPPHPKEYIALRDARRRLREHAEKADVITISHYHFDHYTATWRNVEAKWSWSSYKEAEYIYSGKMLYVKDYRSSINYSQRKRGYIFSKIAQDFVKKIHYADSTEFKYGETTVSFSQPIPHGEEDGQLGYVICITIRHGDTVFMYCPDVQGPTSERALEMVKRESPTSLMIGGPPTYLSPDRVAQESIEKGLQSLGELSTRIPLMIVDHHLLRDEAGLQKLETIRRSASNHGNRVVTAAEYLGVKNTLLEARRPHLYEEIPPSQEFQSWMKLPLLRQRFQLPPL